MIIRKGLDICGISSTAYLQNLEALFQKSILGTEQSLSYWKLRYSKDDSGIIKIEAIQERNSIVQAMMDASDHIAAITSEQQHFRAKLILACSKYQAAMNLLMFIGFWMMKSKKSSHAWIWSHILLLKKKKMPIYLFSTGRGGIE